MAAEPGARPSGPKRYNRTTDQLEFNRFTALCDGVFAIAMTLLVVTVAEPSLNAANAGDELYQLLPQIIAFFVSFAVIGRYWLAHHEFVSLLTTVSARLLFWNLVYLALIAFLPFTTNLLGDFNKVALVVGVYALNVAAISGLETVMFAVSHRSRLFERPLPQDVYRYAVLESLVPVAVFVVSVPVAWASVYAAYACWAGSIAVLPLVHRRRPADADAYLP